MTASRWTSGVESDDGERQSRYRNAGDRALIDGMRTLDPAALEEFVARFEDLVTLRAKKHRVPLAERRAWVADLLYDVAGTLSRQARGTVPEHLAGYLIGACRRKALAMARDRLVREQIEDALAREGGGAAEHAVLSVCSEHSVRSTYGADVEPAPLPPVLERLVSMFDEGISDDERQLLAWIGQRIPYSEIAQWLGDTRTAVAKRVSRLRGRLIESALRFGTTLEREDRRELLRFLRRSDFLNELELRTLAAAPQPRDASASPRTVPRSPVVTEESNDAEG